MRRMRLPGNKCQPKKVPTPSVEGSALRHTSDKLDLGDTVGVTENDTNLRRSSTLSGELADLLNNLLGGGLQPAGSGAAVGQGRGGDTLSFAVKSTHFVGVCRLSSSVEDGVFEMEIPWAGATKFERPRQHTGPLRCVEPCKFSLS